MMTWCEWNPIIVGVGAALLGAAMMWLWQNAKQLTLNRTLDEHTTASNVLQKELEETKNLLKKYQTTNTTLPSTIHAANDPTWEAKYLDLLQKYQLQEQKWTQTQQVFRPVEQQASENNAAWETNYKQVVHQYINAKERIRALEAALKAYPSNDATLLLSKPENSTTSVAVPSYWKKAYDDLSEKYNHLTKQFQASHTEIDVLAQDKEVLQHAYIRAKEDSEYRELYEALLVQQRAYEQAIVELEEQILKLRDREI